MLDIPNFDWANIMGLVLIVGTILVSIAIIFLAYLYLRANRDFELSFMSLGTQKDLAQLNNQLIVKRFELNRLKEQEAILSNNINDLESKQATVYQVKSELDTLGLQYSQKRDELERLDRDLSKSKALQEFVENHQQEQLSEIDSLIKEKEKRLNELSAQVTELNASKSLGDAMEKAFSDINQQLSQSIDAVSDELSSLGKIQASKSKLEDQIQDLNADIAQLEQDYQEKIQDLKQIKTNLNDHKIEQQVGKSLGEVFENLTDSLNEQISTGLGSLGDSLNKQLSQSIDAVSDELSSLGKIQDSKSKLENQLQDLQAGIEKLEEACKEKNQELNKIKTNLNDHKIEQQVGKSLGEVFENLTDSLNEQISTGLGSLGDSLNNSMASLGADLSNVLDLSDKQNQLAGEVDRLTAERDKLLKENERLTGQSSGKEQVHDDAFLELETPPIAIEEFLNNFEKLNTTFLYEREALQQFKKYLRANRLYYPTRVINAFHTALKIQSINPLSVLAGVSGTGKTQLALHYAKFFSFYSEHVAVQPRWDSKDDLLGFFNFLEKRFQPTELVKALYYFHDKYKSESQSNEIKPNSPMMMAILDEMNLARVEYYFSEFLSKLELRALNYDKSKITIGSNLNNRDFYVGSNVLIVGTMNDDESTYALSDKVLDRANVLHFGKPSSFNNDAPQETKVSPIKVDYQCFKKWCEQDNLTKLDTDEREEINKNINKLNEALDMVGKPFGHRVNKSIMSYLRTYPSGAETFATVKQAFADQIEMKIIPKLAGLDDNDASRQCLETLAQVISFTEDTELIKAFDYSRTKYDEDNMFIWRGVTRSLDD